MFNIHSFIDSLPDDTTTIDISNKELTVIPDLSRFTKLEQLYCCHNRLTLLPTLNENLKVLNCSNNKLTYLPPLNEKIKILHCNNNRLTSLPIFNENLKILYCQDNKITVLYRLNEKLEILECNNNRLTSLPVFNENLKILHCHDNPFDVLNSNDTIDTMRRKIKTLHNFRHLYYCLTFKTQFRKWLWERVREPKIALKYHPSYLAEHLIDGTEL